MLIPPSISHICSTLTTSGYSRKISLYASLLFSKVSAPFSQNRNEQQGRAHDWIRINACPKTDVPLSRIFFINFLSLWAYRWTAANRPHRHFTSPHTDGPSPLPATLLTLGLWLDGSIIVPAYVSSPHKLPSSFCGLGGIARSLGEVVAHPPSGST